MQVPQLSAATAWAIACPACMTLDLAASCAPFVTTVVHGTDIVPTFSSGAIDRLRHEVRSPARMTGCTSGLGAAHWHCDAVRGWPAAGAPVSCERARLA